MEGGERTGAKQRGPRSRREPCQTGRGDGEVSDAGRNLPRYPEAQRRERGNDGDGGVS